MDRLKLKVKFIFDAEQKMCLEVKLFWREQEINTALSSLSMFLFQNEKELDQSDIEFAYSLGKFIKKIQIGTNFYLAIPHDHDIISFFEKAAEFDSVIEWKIENSHIPIVFNAPLPYKIDIIKKGNGIELTLGADIEFGEPYDWLSFYANNKHMIFSDGFIQFNPHPVLEDLISELQDKGSKFVKKDEVEIFLKNTLAPLENVLHINKQFNPEEFLPKVVNPEPVLTVRFKDNIVCPELAFQYNDTVVNDQHASVVKSKFGEEYQRNMEMEMSFQSYLMTCFEKEAIPFLLQSPGDIDIFINKIVPNLIEQGWFVHSEIPEFTVQKEAISLEFNIQSSGQDWFSFEPSFSYQNQSFSLQEMASLLSSNNGYLKTKKGYVKITKESQDELALLRKSGALKAGKKFSKDEIIPLIAASNISSEKEECKTLIDSIKHIEKINIPTLSNDFNGTLRDYQHYGVNWMYSLKQLGMGGILADDMGLGKTVQTIAFSTYLSSENPILIIGPTNVVFNWKDEINKFLPSASVLLYNGQNRENKIKKIASHRFIISSLGVIKNDIELLKHIKFTAIFIDEAQYIKNSNTQIFKAVKELVSPIKIAMTGTPIENHMSDLWSLFDFCIPDYLGPKRQFDVTVKDDNVGMLKTRIKPFILRREKREVLNSLPEKTEIILKCPLTPEQEKLYETILLATKKGIKNSVGKQERINILTALLKLRQVCIHPGLIENLDLKNMKSNKFELIKEKITELTQKGHKVVIFSQFTKMLDILSEWTASQHIKTYRIDGTISGKKRQDTVKEFQENTNASIFAISLKAGGVGINLTSADYVIHMDPWWNPAIESQATDRVHRMGQKNKVIVYKLYTENTIEEKILELQQEKQSLISEIIDIDSIEKEKINISEIKNILFS